MKDETVVEGHQRGIKVAFVALNPSHSAMQTKFRGQVEGLEELVRRGEIAAAFPMVTTRLTPDIDVHALGSSSVKYPTNRRWAREWNWLVNYNRLLRMVVRECLLNGVDVLYIRKPPGFDWRAVLALRRLRRAGVRVLFEVPTYPYDSELTARPFTLFLDRCARRFLRCAADRVVTVSSDDVIFGVPSIKLDNGVDLSTVPVRTPRTKRGGVTLISVSSLLPWHRLDRIVSSVRTYWAQGGTEIQRLLLVGEGECKDDLVQAAQNDPRIQFCAKAFGPDLDRFFDGADIGVGALAEEGDRGLTHVAALKHREYAARGLPFFYGMTDPGFTGTGYAMQVADGSLDLHAVMRWWRALNLSPNEIRRDAERFSWANQMGKVLREAGAS